MDDTRYPKLVLPNDFDARDLFELKYKGWFAAEVKTFDGRCFPVNFFDPVRLQQTIIDAFEQGECCLAEPNLVILPEVTIERMEQAIVRLVKVEFFR